ncbi:DUF1287 domain-containing protein [Bifidobacterium leontopitheci]|uniref:DUF1287 domain-containing protein n=1 Tax=Bifidobacterium leontopitheci TaxID=2650774 RepID=A0A6I1GNK1_9BIFI|nr:DUF1287 domain-containing protein [Bifidobacterium leontopitheci]KAB7790969.1 hypothetical protein F7D09_0515 [Bifidobacterium leontopitheci]
MTGRYVRGGQDGRTSKRALAVVMVAVVVLAAVTAGLWVWRADVIGAVKSLATRGAALSSDGQEGQATRMPAAEAAKRYPRLTSATDYNGNGVDDYTDILDGARKDAEARPAYDSGYYQGGYPPADRGACTDLVWRAFRQAGYDLKAMVDADIAADPSSYAAVAANPAPNIDFRRTGVLDVFFRKYGQTLTTDTSDYAQWQAGDIVVFQHVKHIGVISDRRDKAGTAYVLHNMNQRERENDYLAFRRHMTVTGHYRWDASKVPSSVLRAWKR